MSLTIGIDFGTTNSLFSVVLKNGKVRSYLENDFPHPSVVCYSAGETICGREAKELIDSMATAESDGIIRSPKRWLGKGVQHVLGRKLEPSAVVADLMRHLREQALERDSEICEFDRAVVSIPVAMDGRRRRELRDALMQAGISIVQFVHEPLAALYAHFRNLDKGSRHYIDHAGDLALVFDWGGGTLDLTLCQLDSGSMSQIANVGDNEVGGDFIDEALQHYVLEKHMGAYGLAHGIDVNAGARAKLLEQCEKAKKRLSERETALVYVPDYFSIAGEASDIECTLERTELEEVAGDYVRRGLSTIDSLLGRLDLDQRRISLCLATGGMINMPAIRSALLQRFGTDRLHVSPRGDRIISEGCAWIAHDKTRVTLAKPLEVVEARQSWLAIFKEGDRLPIEGEVFKEDLILYCVDPRDGKAKFQFVRPRHLGRTAASDPRDTYTNLSLRVDPGSKPFFERLDLRLTIDADLIVAVEARSALTGDRDADEIYDLEFSLGTDTLVQGKVPPDSKKTKKNHRASDVRKAMPAGAVCMRSNVSVRPGRKELVPGELLYQVDPGSFDRRNPQPLPQICVDERLYYEPCSICGRRYNHPECSCASQLPH
jgi:molecular chaperone DnaK